MKLELQAAGFKQSLQDQCLFITGEGESRAYVLVHVDDALVVGKLDAVCNAKNALSCAFDIKDLGEASYFLGLEIERDRGNRRIWVGQTKYCIDKLEEFGMSACKPQSTPCDANAHLSKQSKSVADEVPYMEVIGSLLYLAVNTRPDISYAVGVLSKYMSAPGEEHWIAAKRVLRYLSGTKNLGVVYGQGSPGVSAFSDSDFAGDVDSRKSTTGVVVVMNGGPVLWVSKQQTVVAASTCEAEYIAAAFAAKEVLWLSALLAEVTGQYRPLVLGMDNQAALTLVKNGSTGSGGRTKHVDVTLHFVRDYVLRGDMSVRYVQTTEMKADVLTKGLSRQLHEKAVADLGLGVRF